MDIHDDTVHEFEPRIIASYDTRNSSSSNLRHFNLSPDGTTLLATCVSDLSQSSTIESIVLPSDLLTSPGIQTLDAYSTAKLPEPVRATTPYSYFELADPSSTLVLVSLPDHPIRLMNALCMDSGIVASYPYIYPETEEFIAPHSLAFTNDGTHFLAGADSEVSVLDVSRPSDGAIERYKLRRNSHLGRSSHWRMKRGIVSTMDISSDDMLAVGTLSREIGLFGSGGQECIAVFELGERGAGAGISQIKWSACDKYLLVSERKSNVIGVYDVRQSHQLLQTLTGGNAECMLRLGWDVTANGEVWGGDVQGNVNIWKGVGTSEGDVGPIDSWQAHDDAVLSTKVHACETVVITGSSKDRNAIASPGSMVDGESGSSMANADKQQLDSSILSNRINVWSLEEK